MVKKSSTTTKSSTKKGGAAVKKGPAKKDGKKAAVIKKAPLYRATPKSFGIGQAIVPKRDLTRFVKWPKYVRLQRQKAVLYKRLKVPPAINQFNNAVDVNTAKNFFKLAAKYAPEDAATKKVRLQKQAAEGGSKQAATKPLFIKQGIKHVTALVEAKKAKLVVIAHDVDPIEVVLWLPALCRKLEVPYMIVKGKSRLGAVVHQKTAAVLAFQAVRKEDQAALQQLTEYAKDNYNNNLDIRRTWGGGKVGVKSQAVLSRRTAAEQKEVARRAMHNEMMAQQAAETAAREAAAAAKAAAKAAKEEADAAKEAGEAEAAPAADKMEE